MPDASLGTPAHLHRPAQQESGPHTLLPPGCLLLPPKAQGSSRLSQAQRPLLCLAALAPGAELERGVGGESLCPPLSQSTCVRVRRNLAPSGILLTFLELSARRGNAERQLKPEVQAVLLAQQRHKERNFLALLFPVWVGGLWLQSPGFQLVCVLLG